MALLKISLFHTPMVTFDGKIIKFPYKKAEAFFYYMAIEKKATREYITELLWENDDSVLAKKNLRHALYSINKIFPEPVITSPQKSSLIFSPACQVECDYDTFADDPESVDYAGLLLEGFYVKDCLPFDEWLDDKQHETSVMYSNRLHTYLYTKTAGKDLEEIEKISELCLADDPLDEKVYKYMMEVYRDHKQYHKAINLYQSLSKILDEDLGLSPSKELSTLHRELLDLWIADSSEDEDIHNVKIRDNKYHYLINAYEHFREGNPENIIITGENGIGKTYLANTSLQDADLSDIYVLEVTCFQSERGFLLQMWNNVYFKLLYYITENNISIPSNYTDIIEGFLPTYSTTGADSYNYPLSFRSFQNAILKVFMLVCHQAKILLYIDNINSCDKVSLEILSSLIGLKNTNLMVLITAVDIMNPDLSAFVSTMVRAGLITQMKVEPLTIEQTGFFVNDSLPDITFAPEDIDRFFKVSGGNIFFLVEMINNIRCNHDLDCLSGTAKEILSDRLNGVSPETRKMLDIISLFEHKAPFSALRVLSSNNSALLDNIEEAKELSLIQETKEESEIYFSFHYHQMRDFIYEQIAPSKLRILHNNIGLALEEVMEEYPDRTICSYKTLAYHFSLGENYRKSLYYRLLYLEHVSSIYFELYPVLDDSILSNNKIELPEDIDSQFAKLSQELLAIHPDKYPELLDEMEARLYHAKSRYYVLICDYEKAISCINKALEKNFTEKNIEFHMDLLKQLIYYSIQVCDVTSMGRYLKEGSDLAERSGILSEQAIYLRLYGYYYMLLGVRKKAVASLLQSINLLEKSALRPELYTINVAAAYNYLGEISLRDGHPETAIEHFKTAIQFCEENGYTVNAVFYTNLGKALFFLDRKRESREAFVAAHQVYRRSTAIVGCATMHAYLAYFAAVDGDMEHAAHHIRMSRRMYERIHSPYEQGVFYFILYTLAKELQKKQAPFITKPAAFYKMKCIELIENLQDNYLLNILKKTD